MGYQRFRLYYYQSPIYPTFARVLGPTGIGITAHRNRWSSILFYLVRLDSLYGNLWRGEIINVTIQRNYPNIFWELTFLKHPRPVSLLHIYLGFVPLSLGEYEILFNPRLVFVSISHWRIMVFFQGLEEFKITVVRNTFVKVISLIMIFTMIRSKKWFVALHPNTWRFSVNR